MDTQELGRRLADLNSMVQSARSGNDHLCACNRE